MSECGFDTAGNPVGGLWQAGRLIGFRVLSFTLRTQGNHLYQEAFLKFQAALLVLPDDYSTLVQMGMLYDRVSPAPPMGMRCVSDCVFASCVCVALDTRSPEAYSSHDTLSGHVVVFPVEARRKDGDRIL